jgi:hypothetical protein
MHFSNCATASTARFGFPLRRAGVRAKWRKAEPNKIEFKRGATSTTISGVVRGDEEAEYTLTARQGQRLTIKLTSTPVKSAVFQLLGPDNDTLGLEFDANFDYSGILPKTGDYFISVKRPTSAKGTSRYKMTVTVR